MRACDLSVDGLLAPSTRTRIIRAFTLIEMLVVLVILVTVMGISIPAISRVRTTARIADTKTLLESVGNSVAQFQLDQRRLPGHFAAKDVGDASNKTEGFTSLDNMMIDLIGGIAKPGSTPTNYADVGPLSAGPSKVRLNLDTLGASSVDANGNIKSSYLRVGAKSFVKQSAGSKIASAGNIDMPALVDSFGTPILAWVADPTPLPPAAPFASADSGTQARYYWASNAAFLNATALGKKGEDQKWSNSSSFLGSLINEANVSNLPKTLEALLGNPAAPVKGSSNKADRPRAPIVLHSAGPNGIYVGTNERGGKVNGGTNLQYKANVDPFGDGSFDDIATNVGN